MLFDFIKRFWLVNPGGKFFPSSGSGGLSSPSYSYNIPNAVRLRGTSSGCLYRTPTIAGSRTKFTLSMTVKRATLATVQGLFGVYNSASSPNLGYNDTGFHFSGDKLVFFSTDPTGANSILVTTNATFKDTFAPYHIVLSVDTTQATAAAGVKIWVNGVLHSYTSPTWTQNTNTFINTLILHYIGVTYGSSNGTPITWQSDCIISEVNFIDGQQLDVSNFGTMDSATNSWKQKKYTGTYGTNGFYLPFTNNTNLTTLGSDQSGNNNNYTPSGISLTAGSTYDSFTDTATNKYCSLNNQDNPTGVPIVDANLGISTAIVGSAFYPVRGNFLLSKGKWYYEVTINTTGAATTQGHYVGIMKPTDSMATINGTDPANQGFMLLANYHSTGAYYSCNYGVYASQNASATTSDVIGVAIDIDAGKIWFSVNGTWLNGGNPAAGTNPAYSSGIAGNSWLPAGYMFLSGGRSEAWNFGQRSFANGAPSGFGTMSTGFLAEPATKDPRTKFSISLYTGNSATRSISNDGLYPDLTWIKERNAAWSNTLFDSVRGVSNYLFSDTTSTEGSNGTTLTAFSANGFSLGGDSLGTVNRSPNTYDAWQWNANNGITSVNTSGSISSVVNANNNSGFSIVTYTGTGANATIGHGLNKAPALIIIKSRNLASSNWITYHKYANAGLGKNGYLYLNGTAAYAADATAWNSADPTASVFSVGSNSNANAAGNTYVAYCFAEVPDFSKIGSFIGTGVANGPFIYTGFRPRFILVRASNAVSNWDIIDTSRDIWNTGSNLLLAPNSPAVEASAAVFDIYSNGFKPISTTNFNTSGNTMIYYAIAEQTLKYANGR